MPLLLIVYLVGVICTAWCLRISTKARERPFFSISSVIWPLTVTVFGLLILLALLAQWSDRLASKMVTHEAPTIHASASSSCIRPGPECCESTSCQAQFGVMVSGPWTIKSTSGTTARVSFALLHSPNREDAFRGPISTAISSGRIP